MSVRAAPAAAAVDAGTRVEGLLDAAAHRWPDAPAVADATGRDAYAQLAHASRAAAGWLADRGVRPGDRVVLRLPGSRAFVALLYGALRLGAIVVPVNPATGSFHLSWMLRDADPALVLTEAGDVDLVRSLTGAPVHDIPVRALADPTRRPDPHRPQWSVERAALLLYTSGSTSMPRAVICPHERVRFAVSAIAARLGYRSDDVVLCRPPVSFDYGLYQIFLCAQAGAELVLRPDLAEARLLRLARSVGATVLPLVPSLATILRTLAQRDPGPTLVRLVTNTGAALTAAQAAGLREVLPAAAVVPMYGMTECKQITIAEPDEDLTHPGTVGRPLDGTEVLVVDADGVPQPAGTVGEIWVRGPHVMAGYWQAPDATAGRFAAPGQADRILRTGDHGYVDQDGRLYFVGRQDDIFKRRGVRLSTPEVEAAALDVPGVLAAAVLPPAGDDDLVIFVAGTIEPATVLSGLSQRLEPAKVPDRCVVLAELPTTVNGKVDRAALRERPELDGPR